MRYQDCSLSGSWSAGYLPAQFELAILYTGNAHHDLNATRAGKGLLGTELVGYTIFQHRLSERLRRITLTTIGDVFPSKQSMIGLK